MKGRCGIVGWDMEFAGLFPLSENAERAPWDSRNQTHKEYPPRRRHATAAKPLRVAAGYYPCSACGLPETGVNGDAIGC